MDLNPINAHIAPMQPVINLPLLNMNESILVKDPINVYMQTAPMLVVINLLLFHINDSDITLLKNLVTNVQIVLKLLLPTDHGFDSHQGTHSV